MRSSNLKKVIGYELPEIKTIIEETFSQGVEYIYDGTNWYDSEGNLLCKSKMGLVGYYLDFEGYTTYKEL